MNWNDRFGDFSYFVSTNMSYLMSEVINENQAYQEYDYLYTVGNRVGQRYGLEAIGFFHSQQKSIIVHNRHFLKYHLETLNIKIKMVIMLLTKKMLCVCLVQVFPVSISGLV